MSLYLYCAPNIQKRVLSRVALMQSVLERFYVANSVLKLICISIINLDQWVIQLNIRDMSKFLTYFSQDVSNICKENKLQLDHFVKQEQNRLIYKQINDEQHHLKNFKSQIDNIKVQNIFNKTNIAKNIVDLTELFNLEMQNYKDEYQRQLDKFFEEYQQIFSETKNSYLLTFRGALEYYFTNPLVLQNKLLSVENPEQYLRQLKQLQVAQTQNLQSKVNELCIKAKALPYVLDEKENYANFKNSLRNLIDNHFNVSIKSNRVVQPPSKLVPYQSPSQLKLQELQKLQQQQQLTRNYSHQQDSGFQKVQLKMEKQYSQQGQGQPIMQQRPASSNPIPKNQSNLTDSPNNNPQVFNNPHKGNVDSVVQKYYKR